MRVSAGRLAVLFLLLGGWGAAQAQVATYRIPRTTHPPKLDGRLDDLCWKSACVVDSFRPLGGPQALSERTVHTKAYLTYDGDALYVAYDCEEPMADKLVIETTQHDGPTWKDDAVEIFFNPSGDRKRYCQIAVNAAGVIMDNYGERPSRKLDLSYETSAKAAAHVGKDRWTLEVRIPFSGLPVEDLECPWTFHLARHRAVVPQLYTCLHSRVTGFHEIGSFDVLKGIALKERRVGIFGVAMGEMLQGTNVTRLRLKNFSPSPVYVQVEAGMEGTRAPSWAKREIRLPPHGERGVKLEWDLAPEHAGKREIVAVRCEGKTLQKRQRLIKEVPPIFGTLNMRAFYLDPNEYVRLNIPVQLASGSRGSATIRWQATDASGNVVGGGMNTVCGDTAIVRLYWARWVGGRYTLKLQLTRKGRPLASRTEEIRLVPSPWAGGPS